MAVAKPPIDLLPRKKPVNELVRYLIDEMTSQGAYDGYTFSKIEPGVIRVIRAIIDNMVEKWAEAAFYFVLTESRGRYRTDKKKGKRVPAIRKTLYEGDFDVVIRTWGRSIAKPEILQKFAVKIETEKKEAVKTAKASSAAAGGADTENEKREGGEGERFQSHYGISSQIIEQLVKRGAPDIKRLSGPKSWQLGIDRNDRASLQRKEVMGVYNRIRSGIVFLVATILRQTADVIVEERPNATNSYSVSIKDVGRAISQLGAKNLR